MPRTLNVLGNYTLDQVILDQHGLGSDMFRTRWTYYVTWALIGLQSVPEPRSKVQWAWDHVLYHKVRAQSSMGLRSYPYKGKFGFLKKL